MDKLRALLWRWRRLVYATLIALIFAGTLSALAPRDLSTIIAINGDLPAGHEISAGDLVDMPGPRFDQPSRDELIGSRLAISLDEGTPLTSSMLIGPSTADHAPPGTVVASVRLATTPEIMPVGSVIDLYRPGEESADKIAENVTILAYVENTGNGSFNPAVSDYTEALLAISRNEAMLVLGISARTPVLAVLHATTASFN